MGEIKLLSLFSGIGAFEEGLKNAGHTVDLVGFSEIDKYAIKSYTTIHNVSEDLNLGDISKIDNLHTLGEVDLVVGGSPCQDFSVAGKKQGSTFTCKDCEHSFNPLKLNHKDRNKCPECGSENLDKTRSSLLIEYLRVIREVRPKYLIYENVKNITGKAFIEGFHIFTDELKDYGYKIDYKVLNACDYKIPQNRERVFVVGVLGGTEDYIFPEKQSLEGIDLRDFLINGYEYEGDIKEEDKIDTRIAPSIKVNFGKDYDLIMNTDKRIHYGKVKSDFSNNIIGIKVSPCLKALNTTTHVKNGKRIQRLRPLESWLLMGFNKVSFDKAQEAGLSDRQLMKQAGNSIVVNILTEIFTELFKEQNIDKI